MNRKS